MADKIPSTSQIADGFYILNLGFVCIYLVRSGDSLLAFDTGMKADKVSAELETLRLDASKVSHVILTHSDRDHVGGLSAFPQARVLMPEAEVSMIDRTTPRFFSFIYNKPFAVSYETLTDNQDLTIGDTRIRCIATPGHTAGHMSYLVNGSILVAGDILNVSGGKVVMDRKFINIDNEEREDSIRRLAALTGVSYLCPMHSGYTNDFETAMKEWR